MSKISRYVGARPFETEHKDIFRGRKGDVKALLQLLQLEQIVSLYGVSGTGKSSLINAGLIPLLEQQTHLDPVRIRFTAYKKGVTTLSPTHITGRLIRGGDEQVNTFLDKLLPDEDTLWHHCKEHFIRHKGDRDLLLIFDQFEELFTYPESMIYQFQQQLAEALYRSAPQRYWDKLEQLYEQEKKPLDSKQLSQLQSKSHVKVLFSLRSDRLHLLNRLTQYLPTIQKYYHELDAISPSSAREAILGPAVLPQGEHFRTAPFVYTKGALDHIVDFLTQSQAGTPDGKEEVPTIQKIEATQLQIICSSIEERVARQQIREVGVEDLGDLQAIIANYYEERINALDEEEQLPAKRLIEEGLIFDEGEGKGIRLSLYEGQITQIYYVQAETLAKLVNSHLLRAEPSLAGGYTYELSHDTLVRPVLEAKAHRLAEEAAIAARVEREQREAEVKKLREEAEKERQRAEEAHRLRQEADKARAEAEAQREKAVAESKRANRQSRRANIFSFFAAITMLTSLIFGISSQRNLRLAREAQARQDLYLFKDLTERGRTLLQSGYIVSAEDLLMRADTLMQKHEENEGFQREKGSLDVLLEEVDRLKNQ